MPKGMGRRVITAECPECGYVVQYFRGSEEDKLGIILCDQCGYTGVGKNVSKPFRGYWNY